MMLDRVKEFLKRVKAELKKKKPTLWGNAVGTPISLGGAGRYTLHPGIREPTVVDRLAAVQDPEIRQWVDTWDRYVESTEQASTAWQELNKLSIARRPPSRPRLDMNYNPLACDEDFFLPSVRCA